MKTTKSKLLKLLVVAMVPLFLSGCLNDLFDSNEITLEDEDQVEFKPLNASLTLMQGESQTETVNVQLIGPQRDQEVPLSVSVVGDETTAEEGIQYTITSNSVTIDANSSVAEYSYEVSGDGLAAGETVTLVLELSSDSEDVQAAENLRRHTLSLQGGGPPEPEDPEDEGEGEGDGGGGEE